MILCLIGLALMTLNETLKPAFGDIICLFAAVFYSIDLMVTEKAVANEKVDPLALGVCDLAVVGVVMLMLSVFWRRLHCRVRQRSGRRRCFSASCVQASAL